MTEIRAIIEDGVIIVDGIAIGGFDLADDYPDIKAINSIDGKVHILRNNGHGYFDDSFDVQPLLVKQAAVIQKNEKAQKEYNESPERLIEHIKAYRVQKEGGGFLIGGVEYESDEKTERRIIGAWVKATADSEYNIESWKTADGFVSLSNAQIIAIGNALDAHIQACFVAEAAALAAFEDDGTLIKEQLEAIFDEVFDA